MSTLIELAGEYGFQPVEMAAFLNVDPEVPWDAGFDPVDEKQYRYVLDNTVDGIYEDPERTGTDG